VPNYPSAGKVDCAVRVHVYGLSDGTAVVACEACLKQRLLAAAEPAAVLYVFKPGCLEVGNSYV